MANTNPAIKNQAWFMILSLESMANPGSKQLNPTMAAGDVKVRDDSGTYTNAATLPVADGAGKSGVLLSLSASEMNNDGVYVQFIDQTSPKEWADWSIFIPTVAGAVATAASIATLQADTDDIQSRLPAALVGGRIDASVGAMAANVMTAAAAAADLTTELQAGLATAAALATVQADTDDIQARLPAALVGGRMDSSVGAMQANVMTAAAAAADLTTELQAGLATAAALATVQADTDNIQTRLPAALVGGRMDSDVGAMQAGVVTAAAVATDAIDADALAANAVAEIQSGLATSANQTTINNNVIAVGAQVTGVQADTDDIQAKIGAPAGVSLAADVAVVKAETASIQGDTNDIQTRLPAALVGGRMDSSIGAVAANAITAASMAADASAEIADRLLGRNIEGGSDGGRTVTEALQPSRNKTEIVAGVLTVYESDDVTPSWTAAVTTAAGNPITSVDPT